MSNDPWKKYEQTNACYRCGKAAGALGYVPTMQAVICSGCGAFRDPCPIDLTARLGVIFGNTRASLELLYDGCPMRSYCIQLCYGGAHATRLGGRGRVGESSGGRRCASRHPHGGKCSLPREAKQCQRALCMLNESTSLVTLRCLPADHARVVGRGVIRVYPRGRHVAEH